MTTDSNQFQQLLADARSGDASAMGLLAERYEPALRAVARVRLGAPLRQSFDSIDLVQSVHKSLMVALRNDRFDIDQPEQLLALAATMVRRKIARHWRKMRRQQSSTVGDHDSAVDLLCQLSTPETEDPSATAAYRETLSRMFTRFSGIEHRLIELRLAGCSTADAAREIGIDPDVARVQLHRLRKRLSDAGVMAELL